MPKVKIYLVTGGAGFIGSNLVRYLYQREPGCAVRVLDKMTYAANPRTVAELNKFPQFKFFKGDICKPRDVARAMDGVDVVVNCAAESAVDRSIQDAKSFLNTDIAGVYVLLQEARRQKQLERFVQISTDEVYGQSLKGRFTERSELKPRNPYAVSKVGGDRLAYSFFVTYGVPVVISRASNNYGPYQYPEKLVPLFITNLGVGCKVPIFGDGRQIRDWLYVEDHCAAIYKLIKRGVNGEVYNIAAGQEFSNLTLTHKILKGMNKDASAIKFVQDRPGHDARYSISTAKIRRLGWQARVDIDQGLGLTIAWFKNNEAWWKPLRQRLDPKYIQGYWGKMRTSLS